MSLSVPSYYGAFRCIAGACRHSCCVGWEIDVDEAAQARYAAIPGPLGDRLRASIEDGSFRLDEEERCPFLNQDGLCEIIIHLGEDALCQICADHPRFRHFLPDRTEVGLGLCCEAAAELILTWPDKVVMSMPAGDSPFLLLRQRLMDIIQDRSEPIEARVQQMLDACDASFPIDYAEWETTLLSLERLDEAWPGMLARLREPPQPIDDLPLEQLMVYLLFRHLEEDDIRARVAYCGLMGRLLRRMAHGDLTEVCRMYSSEIEYSDENLDAILAKIDEKLFD